MKLHQLHSATDATDTLQLDEGIGEKIIMGIMTLATAGALGLGILGAKQMLEYQTEVSNAVQKASPEQLKRLQAAIDSVDAIPKTGSGVRVIGKTLIPKKAYTEEEREQAKKAQAEVQKVLDEINERK